MAFVKHPVLRFGLAIGWTIILTIILLQPESQPIIPTGVQPAPPSLEREILFSTMHILTFTVTALIWCFAFNISSDSRRKLMFLGVILLLFGLTVEYLQTMVPGRTAQWWDMLANSIGITVGWGLWRYFHHQPIPKLNEAIHQFLT